MKGSDSNEQATIEDAKIYINEIKDAFKDEKYKYNEFLKAMKVIKEKRIDITYMVARVKKLFEGHRELLLKFNTYFLDEFEITPPPEKPEVNIDLDKVKGSCSNEQVTSEDAKIYINEIRDTFKDEKHKYNEFLKTMKDIRKRRIDIKCMLARVKELFEGHNELLLKFNTYLPEEFEIKPSLEKSEITPMLKKPKITSPSEKSQLPDITPLSEKLEITPPKEKSEKLVITPPSEKSEKAEITPPQEKAGGNIQYARKYLNMVKTRFQDAPHVYQSFLAIMKMYRNREKSGEEISRMVISLFEDHTDLIDGFIEFLP